MKKLGKFQTLALVSLSSIVLAVPIILAQTTGGDQNSQKPAGAEWHGRGKGGRGKGVHGPRGGFGRGQMFGQLNLTEDQKTRMKQIHESFGERTKSLREQLRAKRQELHQASEGNTFNEALATQKLQEAAGLEAKLMGERFKLHQEMLTVLTAEQKTQLEQKRAEFKSKREQRREHQVQ
ncbi:MAG TPA: Spy/CpxP family protein refolding chaperone [Pyrinomonadaceae bacterium]|nr:Spy/CpxP family protein refolding chaperone [Pyrinomonadaceae bacterium]